MKKLPKNVDKLPRGVEVHGNQVRISFMYRRQRCREPLDGVAKITKSTIAYAANKRRVILTEIAEGRFDYAAHFPNSPKALMFAGYGADVARRTVEDGVNKWLKVQEAMRAPSTFRNYRHKAHHVVSKWGRTLISEISKSDLQLFQSELITKKSLSPKTVNDIFTVIRGVWVDAFHDGAIQSNPLDRIKNLVRDDDEDTADPFERSELQRIAKVKSRRPQDIHLVMFASWSGLSLSEVMALAWEDVDTDVWQLKVRRAKVGRDYKVPKERSRVRMVELIDPAIYWLQQQMPYTMMLPQREVSVRQRDNITIRADAVRFVFMNGTGEQQIPWHDPSLRRRYTDLLVKAKVRHRGPNQCRHTFASQALSNYVPMEWVARQLGHTDTTMIKKHYGRWIPQDTRSMAGMVSEMMGFRGDRGGQKNGISAPNLPQTSEDAS